jgi:hypothetical protein
MIYWLPYNCKAQIVVVQATNISIRGTNMPGKRGPKISLDAMRMIRESALSLPHEPRTRLAESLQSQLEARRWPVPQVETLEKIISEVRNKYDEPDRPFSLVALVRYPIAPEALPYVLKVWARSLTAWPRAPGPGDGEYLIFERQHPRFVPRVHTLTIRHALWVARLYRVIIDPSRQVEDLEVVDLDRLWSFAEEMAGQERLLESEKEYPRTRRDAWYWWLNDARLYELLPGEPSREDLETQILNEMEHGRQRIPHTRGA